MIKKFRFPFGLTIVSDCFCIMNKNIKDIPLNRMEKLINIRLQQHLASPVSPDAIIPYQHFVLFLLRLHLILTIAFLHRHINEKGTDQWD